MVAAACGRPLLRLRRVGFVRATVLALTDYGITINCLCPAVVDTQLNGRIGAASRDAAYLGLAWAGHSVRIGGRGPVAVWPPATA